MFCSSFPGAWNDREYYLYNIYYICTKKASNVLRCL